MSDVEAAIREACEAVEIDMPKAWREGQWCKADTHSGRNGRGDGRVMVDGTRVTAWNWQTGESRSIRLDDGKQTSPTDARHAARRRRQRRQERERQHRETARIAAGLLKRAGKRTHGYLAAKGLPAEKTLVVPIKALVTAGVEYVLDGQTESPIIVPAMIGDRVTNAQLIWPDGAKRFLFGGKMHGASCRLSTGRDTWLCEGLSTGLTILAALRGLQRQATVRLCFSAANIPVVAEKIPVPCYVAADNDKPIDRFGGVGTGEHYARQCGHPYGMPRETGTDFNDLFCREGIFAVQKHLLAIVRSRPP